MLPHAPRSLVWNWQKFFRNFSVFGTCNNVLNVVRKYSAKRAMPNNVGQSFAYRSLIYIRLYKLWRAFPHFLEICTQKLFSLSNNVNSHENAIGIFARKCWFEALGNTAVRSSREFRLQFSGFAEIRDIWYLWARGPFITLQVNKDIRAFWKKTWAIVHVKWKLTENA